MRAIAELAMSLVVLTDFACSNVLPFRSLAVARSSTNTTSDQARITVTQ